MTLSSLTIKEWKLAESLLKSDSHIVVEADKNLGGCIMDRETCTMKGILEHVGNTEVYQKLTKEKPLNMSVVRYKINIFLSEYKEDLSPAKRHFTHEGLFKY